MTLTKIAGIFAIALTATVANGQSTQNMQHIYVQYGQGFYLGDELGGTNLRAAIGYSHSLKSMHDSKSALRLSYDLGFEYFNNRLFLSDATYNPLDGPYGVISGITSEVRNSAVSASLGLDFQVAVGTSGTLRFGLPLMLRYADDKASYNVQYTGVTMIRDSRTGESILVGGNPKIDIGSERTSGDKIQAVIAPQVGYGFQLWGREFECAVVFRYNLNSYGPYYELEYTTTGVPKPNNSGGQGEVFQPRYGAIRGNYMMEDLQMQLRYNLF